MSLTTAPRPPSTQPLPSHGPSRQLLTIDTSRYASPFPTPRQPSATSPSSAAPLSPSSAHHRTPTHPQAPAQPLATLRDLPPELLLQIAHELYLPPDEFASAHARSAALRALGLAGGPAVQQVVRAVLFREVGVRSEDEVRFLVRRPELAGLVRHLTIQSPLVKRYLQLLLPLTPLLSTLSLACKFTTPDVPLLTALPRATAPDLKRLSVKLAEPLSVAFCAALSVGRDGTLRKVEELAVESRFLRDGLMEDVVEVGPAEFAELLDKLATAFPALRTLVLPVVPAPSPSRPARPPLATPTSSNLPTPDADRRPPTLPAQPAPAAAAAPAPGERPDGPALAAAVRARLPHATVKLGAASVGWRTYGAR